MKKFKNNIRNILLEELDWEIEERGELDEERYNIRDFKEKAINKENAVGSHIFGELLGDVPLEEKGMYVVISYENFPLFLFSRGKWFESMTENPDVDAEKWTERHRVKTRPGPTHRMPVSWMMKVIRKFKKKHGIVGYSHDGAGVGEK